MLEHRVDWDAHRQVKLAFLDLIEKRRCSTFDEANVDPFMLAQVTTHDRCDYALHGHGRGSYRERPATARSQRLCARHKGLCFSKHIAAVREQGLAFTRQTQATASTVEEPHAQCQFEL